jgi:hypothetical protein
MNAVENQLPKLRTEFPSAELTPQPNGSVLVTVRDLALPERLWNKPTTTVYFIAPVGYPMARPDCFWTDPDLRMASGAPPQNTGQQTPPFDSQPKLWFSWHPSSWSANRDDLLTYTRLIQERLKRAE